MVVTRSANLGTRMDTLPFINSWFNTLASQLTGLAACVRIEAMTLNMRRPFGVLVPMGKSMTQMLTPFAFNVLVF